MTWINYAIGTNQIIATDYGGRDCYQMTVARDEPMNGLWGDGKGGKVRKRAQFREDRYHVLGVVERAEFATCIPPSWEPHDVPTLIAQIHQYTGLGRLPFALYEWECDLVISLMGVEPWNYKHVILVPDQWDDWVVEYLPHLTAGYVKIWRNGNLVVDLSGVATAYVEPAGFGNYTVIGPYIAAADGTVDLPRWRRMFIQATI